MKVHIVQTEYGTIVGVFENVTDAQECAAKTANTLDEFEVTPNQQPTFIPEGWTKEQTQSAIRVCKNYGEPFSHTLWTNYGEYIGKGFHKGTPDYIFIGIEKDGYAHS
jgi:hypothetical protein